MRNSRLRGNTRRWRQDTGATLLEILVVLSIIALLAAVVGPRVVGYLGKAKSTTTELQLDNLKVAVELFYVDVGRYPTEEEGLSALLRAPSSTSGWAGPYLDAADALSDPWDREYIYKAPGDEGRPFTILSLGRDGAEGGDGEDADLRI